MNLKSIDIRIDAVIKKSKIEKKLFFTSSCILRVGLGFDQIMR